MWRIEAITYYRVTNGIISTNKQHTSLEDAQSDLAEQLEGIKEVSEHEKLVLPEGLSLQD